MARNFRFGLQLATGHDSDPVEVGRRAEAAGFDVLLVSDHVGPGMSPMPTLGAVAAATSTVRLGTFVLNADMRNPVQLGWESTTLDKLSGGRFELGLGAGHTPHEYAETGVEFRPPRVRKDALTERVEILRRLLDGEAVDWNSEHHRLVGASVDRSTQHRLPILVGGNGDALLAHAATHADIIGLQGLARTLEDGHRHTVKWSTAHLDAQVEHLRQHAGERFDRIELNALVQIVDVTDDAESSLTELLERLGSDGGGACRADLSTIPYALIGSVDEIVEQLHACRERWGISYFVVRDLEAFEPVIAACR